MSNIKYFNVGYSSASKHSLCMCEVIGSLISIGYEKEEDVLCIVKIVL